MRRISSPHMTRTHGHTNAHARRGQAKMPPVDFFSPAKIRILTPRKDTAVNKGERFQDGQTTTRQPCESIPSSRAVTSEICARVMTTEGGEEVEVEMEEEEEVGG